MLAGHAIHTQQIVTSDARTASNIPAVPMQYITSNIRRTESAFPTSGEIVSNQTCGLR